MVSRRWQLVHRTSHWSISAWRYARECSKEGEGDHAFAPFRPYVVEFEDHYGRTKAMGSAPDIELVVDAIYARGSVHDRDGRTVPLLPHSVERAQGEALRDLATAERAERTIEVGLALGMSALFLCQAVLPHGGRHVAIDPFQTESWNGAGLRTLRDAGVEEHVEVIQEQSQLALPRLVSEGREFDLGFIDGDHRFEGVFLDLYFMTRLVRPGRLVVVDDMWMPAVRMAVAYVEKNLGATLEPDALPSGFRWRNRPLSRGVPSGMGDTAVLRLASERPSPRWDEFVPPY
jgi:predicted O-methyltransferase YrrM